MGDEIADYEPCVAGSAKKYRDCLLRPGENGRSPADMTIRRDRPERDSPGAHYMPKGDARDDRPAPTASRLHAVSGNAAPAAIRSG